MTPTDFEFELTAIKAAAAALAHLDEGKLVRLATNVRYQEAYHDYDHAERTRAKTEHGCA
jgi:hypothetical protein